MFVKKDEVMNLWLFQYEDQFVLIVWIITK